MTVPSERAFVTFERGRLRDEMLAMFRSGLRRLVNPATKTFFSEEDIRLATQEGSRDYLRFDAIDLGLQAGQQRARFTAQQTDPTRASSSWLRGFHCRLWGIVPLPASSGSGPVSWKATTGAVFVGSTTLGDPGVFTATDPQGNVYQAFSTVTASAGVAALIMVAVSGGKGTNPKSTTIFAKSANGPASAEPTGTAAGDFKGGFDEESDADIIDRLIDRIRRRPASGNRAQFRLWARGVTTAIENAFVYPCLFNAGSVAVAIVQKRGNATGPLARIPSDVPLVAARNFLTPPGSSVVPARVFVLVHKAVSDPTSLSMRLKMRPGTSGGWFDSQPWPTPVGTSTVDDAFCGITTLTSQSEFRVQSSTAPATGVVPTLMVWDALTSTFVKLDVSSVTFMGGTEYKVILPGLAPKVLALGDIICPYTPLLAVIAQAAETYFDSLGPGEMVDLATPRAKRAYRWPDPGDEMPYEAGQSIVSSLGDALGRALSNAQLAFISKSTPGLPTDLSKEGPKMLTLGGFGVYPS